MKVVQEIEQGSQASREPVNEFGTSEEGAIASQATAAEITEENFSEQNLSALSSSDIDAEDWQIANDYFEQYHQISFEWLLSPPEEGNPCGPDLRGHELYTEIVEARRADDPSLPRGDWAFDLKRADWNKVSHLATRALTGKTKDLQMTAWLLEAEIRLRGFQAIAPVLILLEQLLSRFWTQLNPPEEDIERRYNIFHWIDQKLAPVINLIPLIHTIDNANTLSGVDLDRALSNQIMVEAKQLKKEQIEGILWGDFCHQAEAFLSEHYENLYWVIFNSLGSLLKLNDRLDLVFPDGGAPGLHSVQEQLEKAMEFACMELERRGLLEALQTGAMQEPETNTHELDNTETLLENRRPQQTNSSTTSSAKMDRQQAYLQLSQIADFLIQIEPHSPVPYLLRRAVDWGRCNTAELYQELFLQNNGQINLFEILGIEPPGRGAAS